MVEKYLANSILFNEHFNSKIVAVDGGARGEVFEPFDRLNKDIAHVYRFEPDQDANIDVEENQTIFKKAIWKESREIDIHIAKNPTASSVYPPNQDLLLRFKDDIGYPPRATVKKVKVDACALDDVFANEKRQPHFLKLDIHGAEYEALLGAKKTINQSVTAVLIETWNIPVHKGQKTHGFIDAYLQDQGFLMIDQLTYSLWERKGPAELASNYNIVTFESIYFKSIDALKEMNADILLPTIAIANLFNQNAFALQVLEIAKEKKLITNDVYLAFENQILSANKEHRFIEKRLLPFIRKKVERKLF